MPSLTLKRTFTPSTSFRFGAPSEILVNLIWKLTIQAKLNNWFYLMKIKQLTHIQNWNLKQFLFTADWFEWSVPTRATSQLNPLENPVLFDKNTLSLPVRARVGALTSPSSYKCTQVMRFNTMNESLWNKLEEHFRRACMQLVRLMNCNFCSLALLPKGVQWEQFS